MACHCAFTIKDDDDENPIKFSKFIEARMHKRVTRNSTREKTVQCSTVFAVGARF